MLSFLTASASDNYFSQAYARLHPRGIGFTITAHFRNPHRTVHTLA